MCFHQPESKKATLMKGFSPRERKGERGRLVANPRRLNYSDDLQFSMRKQQMMEIGNQIFYLKNSEIPSGLNGFIQWKWFHPSCLCSAQGKRGSKRFTDNYRITERMSLTCIAFLI